MRWESATPDLVTDSLDPQFRLILLVQLTSEHGTKISFDQLQGVGEWNSWFINASLFDAGRCWLSHHGLARHAGSAKKGVCSQCWNGGVEGGFGLVGGWLHVIRSWHFKVPYLLVFPDLFSR